MIVRVRLLLVLVLAIGALLTLVATGYTETVGGRAYSAGELPGIVDPGPSLPPWTFKQGDPYFFPIPAHAPAFTLKDYLGDSPTSGDRMNAKRLKRAGFQIGRHLRWDKINAPANLYAAVVFAFLFRKPAGARAGFRVLTGFAPHGNVPAKGLGQQSMGVHTDDAVRYVWRRSNLVIMAGLDCEPECDFPVVGPARKYADQIDARAK